MILVILIVLSDTEYWLSDSDTVSVSVNVIVNVHCLINNIVDSSYIIKTIVIEYKKRRY